MYEFDLTVSCTRWQAEYLMSVIAKFAEYNQLQLAGGFSEVKEPPNDEPETGDVQAA